MVQASLVKNAINETEPAAHEGFALPLEVTPGNLDDQVPRSALSPRVVADEGSIGSTLLRAEGDLSLLTLCKQLSPHARCLDCSYVREAVRLSVEEASSIAEPLVEDVAPNLVVANALDLEKLAPEHAAEGQIQGTAPPVEDQQHAAFQLSYLASEVGTPAEISVKGSDGLVDELDDADSGLPGSGAQFAPLRSFEVDRDRHYGALDLVRLATRAWLARIGAKKAENLGNRI
jgi:hypothetical protein